MCVALPVIDRPTLPPHDQATSSHTTRPIHLQASDSLPFQLQLPRAYFFLRFFIIWFFFSLFIFRFNFSEAFKIDGCSLTRHQGRWAMCECDNIRPCRWFCTMVRAHDEKSHICRWNELGLGVQKSFLIIMFYFFGSNGRTVIEGEIDACEWDDLQKSVKWRQKIKWMKKSLSQVSFYWWKMNRATRLMVVGRKLCDWVGFTEYWINLARRTFVFHVNYKIEFQLMTTRGALH